MAGQNWGVRNNSISLDEMIKIPQMAVEEHNAIEKGIADLQSQADKWEMLANSAQDQDAYAQYKSYSDQLRKESDKLAMYGINANSRRDLYKLSSEYAKTIEPISQAYDYRAKMIDEQRKNNKDGNMIYDVDFSQVSLQDIMNNPNLSYKGINLEDARQQGGLAGVAASKRNVLTPEEKLIMNGQYYDLITRQGYTEEQAAQFLADPKNNPALAAYVDQAYQSYNTDGFSDAQKKQIRDKITMGLVQGLTFDEKHQMQGNGEYMTAYQKEMMNYKRAEEERKAEMQEKQMQDAGLRETDMGTSPDGKIRYMYVPPKKGAMSGQIWAYEYDANGNVTKKTPVKGGGVFNWNQDLFDPADGSIKYGARRSQSSNSSSSSSESTTKVNKNTQATGLNLASKAYYTDLRHGMDEDTGGHSIDEIIKNGNYNEEDNTFDSGIYRASVSQGSSLSEDQQKALKQYIKENAKNGMKFPKTPAGDVDLSNVVVILDKDWGTKNHWKIIAKDLFIEKCKNAGFTDDQVARMLMGSDYVQDQSQSSERPTRTKEF